MINKTINKTQIILNLKTSTIKLNATKGRIENKERNKAKKIFMVTPVIILLTNKEQHKTAQINIIVSFGYFLNPNFLSFRASIEKYATGIENATF